MVNVCSKSGDVDRNVFLSSLVILLLLMSERSERDSIRGNKWKWEIYIYSMGTVLCNVGGVKCQPFLKH